MSFKPQSTLWTRRKCLMKWYSIWKRASQDQCFPLFKETETYTPWQLLIRLYHPGALIVEKIPKLMALEWVLAWVIYFQSIGWRILNLTIHQLKQSVLNLKMSKIWLLNLLYVNLVILTSSKNQLESLKVMRHFLTKKPLIRLKTFSTNLLLGTRRPDTLSVNQKTLLNM